MQKTIFLSYFLLITTMSIYSLGNQDTQNDPPIEISSQGNHGQGPDYEKMATELSVNVEDLIDAFEESESETPLDLKTIATKLNVTEKEFSDAMGPPHQGENRQDSQPLPQNGRKIFSSQIADYGNMDFEISSLAIEDGELLDAYKCEKKIIMNHQFP